MRAVGLPPRAQAPTQRVSTAPPAASLMPAPASSRAAERVAGDRPQDLGPGQERPRERPADLAVTDARPVVHGDLPYPQAPLGGLDLHLDRPAEVAVAHLEPAQRARGDGPEGPEVRGPGADEQVHEPHAEAGPEHGVEGMRSRRAPAEAPRAAHEVGGSG